jgi:hypothetical protein
MRLWLAVKLLLYLRVFDKVKRLLLAGLELVFLRLLLIFLFFIFYLFRSHITSFLTFVVNCPFWSFRSFFFSESQLWEDTNAFLNLWIKRKVGLQIKHTLIICLADSNYLVLEKNLNKITFGRVRLKRKQWFCWFVMLIWDLIPVQYSCGNIRK